MRKVARRLLRRLQATLTCEAPKIRRKATASWRRRPLQPGQPSQTADQDNTNSATTTLPALGVADNDTAVPLPQQFALQLEGVLQANANLQDGAAIAAASSDYVSVEQGGPLSAGIDGIDATSSAVAGANLSQSATQDNSDTKTIARAADGPAPGEDQFSVQPEAIALQLEGVLQINASGQKA